MDAQHQLQNNLKAIHNHNQLVEIPDFDQRIFNNGKIIPRGRAKVRQIIAPEKRDFFGCGKPRLTPDELH
jgi:hypothetical protein